MYTSNNNSLEVLISAMHQKDASIVSNTNIKTDVLIINQTDENSFYSEDYNYGKVRMISTTDRGLSKSRNMAIENANNRYCLLCDDDEVLDDDYKEIILSAFKRYPDAGIICFKVIQGERKYSDKRYRIGFFRSLRIASWQIAFDKNVITDKGIKFDEMFGSGTPIGSGEENIFLYDCLKKGIKIYYVPQCIGSVAQISSQWFKGYDESYFKNRGIIIQRLMGRHFGFFYCLYFVLTKKSLYKQTTKPWTAWKAIMNGLRFKIDM